MTGMLISMSEEANITNWNSQKNYLSLKIQEFKGNGKNYLV